MPDDNEDALASIDKTEQALGALGGIVGGLMTAINTALAELAELKKDLQANPTIDSSASDDEAAATAADMPEPE